MRDWAGDYVGIPYGLHGRARPALDCWGLVRLVMLEKAGIELPMWDAVLGGDEAYRTILIEGQDEGQWRQVDPGAARTFDVAVMRGIWRGVNGRRHAGDIHCGIVVPGTRILHVERESDAACVPLARLSKRITGIYRFWRLEQ